MGVNQAAAVRGLVYVRGGECLRQPQRPEGLLVTQREMTDGGLQNCHLFFPTCSKTKNGTGEGWAPKC